MPAGEAFRITRSLPHGHVEAVLSMIRRLGVDELIAAGASRRRDLVIAMIAERLLFPSSKLANTRHWHSTTLASRGWTSPRPPRTAPVRRHGLVVDAPGGDREETRRQAHQRGRAGASTTSPAAPIRGRPARWPASDDDCDGKTGCPIIVYGLADRRRRAADRRTGVPRQHRRPQDRPRPGRVLTKRFGLSRVVLVGDRGMLSLRPRLRCSRNIRAWVGSRQACRQWRSAGRWPTAT